MFRDVKEFIFDVEGEILKAMGRVGRRGGGMEPGGGVGDAEGEVGDDKFIEFEGCVDFVSGRRVITGGVFEIGDGGESEFIGGEGVISGDGGGKEAIAGETMGQEVGAYHKQCNNREGGGQAWPKTEFHGKSFRRIRGRVADDASIAGLLIWQGTL